MKIILDTITMKEFDKFLKYAKTQGENDFKVVLNVGIEVYEQEIHIASIYYHNRKGIIADTETPRFKKRFLSVDEKLNKAKQIYEMLIEKYKEVLI